MTEQNKTESLPSDAATEENIPRRRRRWPHYLFGGILLISGLGEIWLWFIWDPPFGRSIQNLVTYGLVLLLFALLLIWVLFFAPLSRKARGGLFLLLFLSAIGYAATIRRIEFTGDMGLVVRHRWEPTQQELIQAHRAAAGAAVQPLAEETPVSARPEDMPSYRGWNAAGFVKGPNLMQDWETDPPQARWRQPCGGGYSQFAVVVPFAVTLEQRGENETVVCYDTESGAERWVYENPGRFDEAMGGAGPRSTPTIDGDEVYAVGALGDLVCLSLRDGSKVWHVNILQEHGLRNSMWGVTSSPFLYKNLVIVNPGGVAGDGLAAYDRKTGKLVWSRDGIRMKVDKSGSKNRMGYSTPMLANIHGVQQLLMFDGTGLKSYLPDTGRLLWKFDHQNDPAVNVAQPLVFEDGRVFISCSYDVGCAMLQVRQEQDGRWSVQSLWKRPNLNLRCKFTSPVLFEGYIYGLDEGILVCLDPETGRRKWKRGRYGHGQILVTNGQFVIAAEDGRIVLGRATPERWEEITSFQALDDRKNWNPPALVDGNLYVRNHLEMARYNVASRRSEEAPVPSSD